MVCDWKGNIPTQSNVLNEGFQAIERNELNGSPFTFWRKRPKAINNIANESRTKIGYK